MRNWAGDDYSPAVTRQARVLIPVSGRSHRSNESDSLVLLVRLHRPFSLHYRLPLLPRQKKQMGSSQSSASSPSPTQSRGDDEKKQFYPSPTGHEYDSIDKLAAQLPNIIDDESRQQVEDYKQACDGGKGPMVACFSTAEFISLFERRHKEAAELYRNVCFRPPTDKVRTGTRASFLRLILLKQVFESCAN